MLITFGSSSNLRSQQDNVRKHVGIPNCLNIASISYKNCFHYSGVPLTELFNENALSLVTNLPYVPLKLFLIALVVILPGLILCIAKFINEGKWY